jgi:hypothetical protein
MVYTNNRTKCRQASWTHHAIICCSFTNSHSSRPLLHPFRIIRIIAVLELYRKIRVNCVLISLINSPVWPHSLHSGSRSDFCVSSKILLTDLSPHVSLSFKFHEPRERKLTNACANFSPHFRFGCGHACLTGADRGPERDAWDSFLMRHQPG